MRRDFKEIKELNPLHSALAALQQSSLQGWQIENLEGRAVITLLTLGIIIRSTDLCWVSESLFSQKLTKIECWIQKIFTQTVDMRGLTNGRNPKDSIAMGIRTLLRSISSLYFFTFSLSVTPCSFAALMK